jgi:hypothetical protein
MIRKFSIPAGSQKLLEKATKRLNKHAKRMGYSETKVISISEPEEALRTVVTQVDGEVDEHSYAVMIRNVEVDIPEQFLNMVDAEWLVLGQIVMAENGEAEAVSEGEHMLEVLKAGEGFGWKCQACKHPLAKAYVVKHKGTSEYKLVGQECLKQYTGADGQAIIALVEFISVIQFKEADGQERGGGAGHVPLHVIDLAAFLATCNAVVRRDGQYVRRWEEEEDRMGNLQSVEIAHCTRNEALAQYVGARGDSKISFQLLEFLVVEVTDADKVVGEKLADAWERCEIPVDNENQYLSQCKALAERGWITEKSAGIAASMIKGPPKAKEPSKSQHIGVIGQRMELKGLKTVFAHTRDGEYGVTTIIKFVDVVGNEYTWFASGTPEFAELDKVWDVKATIKAHDEYKGAKQTIINRVKQL